MGKRSSNRLSRVTEGIKVPRAYHGSSKLPRALPPASASGLPGGRPQPPGLPTRPDDVLDIHADLARRMARPNDELVRYFTHFMLSKCEKDGRQAAGMFYPVPVQRRRPAPQDGRRLASIFARSLSVAATYQVTAEMVDAVAKVATANALTDHVDEAELPCADGFAWLDAPWTIRGLGGDLIKVRALTWEYAIIRSDGIEGEDGVVLKLDSLTDLPSVRLGLWSSVEDDLADGLMSLDEAEQTRQWEGLLSLLHVAVIPFGLPFTWTEVKSGNTILSIVHALWMFLGMEIVSTTPVQAGRQARRRAMGALRSLRQGEVNVVILRRVRHATDPEGTVRDVDWSCRWPVQGHWRHLDQYEVQHHHAVAVPGDRGEKHCAVCHARLTYIRAYLKGPDGLPLKVSKQLLKLAR